MAFVDTLDRDDLKKFYNVDFTVGENAPNRQDDVMLVQYILRRLYQNPTFSTGDNTLSTTAPKGDMKVDGVCGPVTLNWIFKYQLDMRQLGDPVFADKRVDRAANHDAFSKLNRLYSIVLMNAQYRNRHREEYFNLPFQPDAPAPLRAALLKGGSVRA